MTNAAASAVTEEQIRKLNEKMNSFNWENKFNTPKTVVEIKNGCQMIKRSINGTYQEFRKNA